MWERGCNGDIMGIRIRENFIMASVTSLEGSFGVASKVNGQRFQDGD
jgi:hypothetical protein